MKCEMSSEYMFYGTVILYTNITFRKIRSNSFKDKVDTYFVNERKICCVKPMKQISLKKTHIECNLFLFIYL